MAVITTLAKKSGMDSRLFMAGSAARRGTAVLVVLVAGLTLQVGMLILQWKSDLVVKPVEAVDAIVACQAVRAVLLDVLLHENLVVGGVA
jgi:hypothetical protein